MENIDGRIILKWEKGWGSVHWIKIGTGVGLS
jgi:hypothetical protein